jgi:hypothetical protein
VLKYLFYCSFTHITYSTVCISYVLYMVPSARMRHPYSANSRDCSNEKSTNLNPTLKDEFEDD